MTSCIFTVNRASFVLVTTTVCFKVFVPRLNEASDAYTHTCFVLSKRDDVLKVTVDEFGESAGLVSPHADLIVLPFTSFNVLLQRHQTPKQKQGISSNIHTVPTSMKMNFYCTREVKLSLIVQFYCTSSVCLSPLTGNVTDRNMQCRKNYLALRISLKHIPAHEISKDVKSIEVGHLTTSVDISACHGLAQLVGVGKYR